MFAAKILDHIKRTGLTISVIDNGKLSVEPKSLITDAIRDQIRRYKVDLIKLLSGVTTPAAIVPSPCRGCKRLEVIEIMDELVPGCLYQAEGEFPEGCRPIAAGGQIHRAAPAAIRRQPSGNSPSA